MSDNIQAAIISGFVALAIWLGSNWANRRAEASKAILDGRAVKVNEKAVDLSVLVASMENLKGRVKEMETSLTTETRLRKGAQDDAAEARRVADKLGTKVRRLEREARMMRQALHDANVPMPFVTDDDLDEIDQV